MSKSLEDEFEKWLNENGGKINVDPKENRKLVARTHRTFKMVTGDFIPRCDCGNDQVMLGENNEVICVECELPMDEWDEYVECLKYEELGKQPFKPLS